jgi:RNA polymerase sigma-70 factor (ECF subfamily)
VPHPIFPPYFLNQPMSQNVSLYSYQGKVVMKNKEQLYDELLIWQAANGDQEAFAHLIQRWSPKLFYYVRRIVAKECDVEDILQNVWLSLYRSLGNIRDIAQYRVFLFSIARSKAFDHLRKKGRILRQEIPLDFDEEQQPSCPDATEQYIKAEEIHNALEHLDHPMRDLLTLYYLNELSLEEIAGILKIPSGTVKSRLHYARNALRKEIERYDNARERKP